MDHYHLGILVRYNFYSKTHPPFNNQRFFEILTLYGQKKGMEITVFAPNSVVWNINKVVGYRYHAQEKNWKKGTFPIPPVVYDRISYTNKEQIEHFHPLIKRLTRQKNVVLLGRGLPGKWKVYNMLKEFELHQSFLPETVLYNPHLKWMDKLKEYKSLFFKPASGSHGRGVFKVTSTKKGLLIQGRNSANKLFTKHFHTLQATDNWMTSFIGQRGYVVQPYLKLSTIDGNPFDIRILVQKNGDGEWEETGRVVRVGKKDTLTSNLDGGGTAVDPTIFLKTFYPPQKVEKINEQISTIVTHLPLNLEEKHGPLLELGIDIGIDQQGNVWILEVNSKPGRKSLRIINHQEAFINSLLAPIRYADYVFTQSGG